MLKIENGLYKKTFEIYMEKIILHNQKVNVELFMSRNLKKEEWVHVISIYKTHGIYAAAQKYCKMTDFIKKSKKSANWLRNRIIKKAKLVDNYGMSKLNRVKGSGRAKKRDDSDIPGIINELNEEQLKEIAKLWIKEQRDKKENEGKNKIVQVSLLFYSLKAKILKIHRTTMYKKPKTKIYKYDYLKPLVETIFIENKGIYGSGKIVQI